MTKLRKIHFVIHNQGAYDQQKKVDLLLLLQGKYGKNLEGFLIAQEHYKGQVEDTHLQGNLFFKNAIHFTALLKLIKSKYFELKTELGLKGRTDLSAVLHEGKAYNYMVNSAKEGGDACPLVDMTAHQHTNEIAQLDRALKALILEQINAGNHREFVRKNNNEFLSTGIGYLM